MKQKKIRPPILPRDQRDPTGVDALERKAIRDLRSRVTKASKAYIKILDQLPVQKVTINRTAYVYQLDATILSILLEQAGQEVDALFLSGGMQNVWFFEAYVSAAYRRGVAQERANLAQQSPSYAAGRQSAAQLMRTEPYIRRMALLAAREFEEMKGLSNGIKADMTRILTDGIGRGQNPHTVAKALSDQTGISRSRADRIARSEIPTALRRARLDEADEAEEAYGLTFMQMHQSALSPTTRRSHAIRHGNLYTSEQQREWWAKDANSINCKCSTLTVLVDEKGKPLVPEFQQRAKATYKKMSERNYQWHQKS